MLRHSMIEDRLVFFGPRSASARWLQAGLVAAFCLAAALWWGPSRVRGHVVELDLSAYTLTFEERFKTLDISAGGPGTRWTAHTPWHGDFGDAVFDDPGPGGPFSLGPSGLKITARKDGAGRWHSGLICSMDKDGAGQHGFAQQYGYFEMRARLPDGPGVWPAFWLIGVDKSKSSAEIDVLEYYGAFPAYFNSWMHVWTNGHETTSYHNVAQVESESLTSHFNTYGVSIEADTTRFFLNRELVWSQPTPAEYNQPFYILANLALGSGWPIDKLQSPAVMEIEALSVYQKTDRVTAERGTTAK